MIILMKGNKKDERKKKLKGFFDLIVTSPVTILFLGKQQAEEVKWKK